MTLHKKLVELRREKRLSQAELAEALKVSRQAISRWEVGSSQPSVENLKCLSQLFDVPLEYLVNDGGELPGREPSPERQVAAGPARARDWKRIAGWVLAALCLAAAIAVISIGLAKRGGGEALDIGALTGEEVETTPGGDFDFSW